MKKRAAIFLFPMLMLLVYCAGGPAVSNYNYAYLYDEKPSVPRPEFQVFHASEEISNLYFKFDSDNILYSKPQHDSVFKAHLQINCKVYEWKNRETLIDSVTKPILDIGANNSSRILIGNIDLRVPAGKKYFLEVRLRDQNRDLMVLNYSMIDKSSNLNRQYFLIEDDQGQVVFGNVLLNENAYTITKSDLVQYQILNVFQASENMPLAAPPFVDGSEASTNFAFTLKDSLIFTDNEAKFQPINGSAFQFFPERMENQGFYLFHFRENYPYITNATEMIPPLRYISTNEEFSALENAEDTKQAVDEYWLNLAGNAERAREAMGEFYSRVERANKYFATNKEGWKTDRGIIYIIYGIPTTIYKTPTFESWIYGEETNVLALNFKFRKTDNPMSNNDFSLIRDIAMKPSWYRAVDSWRQARIN